MGLCGALCRARLCGARLGGARFGGAMRGYQGLIVGLYGALWGNVGLCGPFTTKFALRTKQT